MKRYPPPSHSSTCHSKTRTIKPDPTQHLILTHRLWILRALSSLSLSLAWWISDTFVNGNSPLSLCPFCRRSAASTSMCGRSNIYIYTRVEQRNACLAWRAGSSDRSPSSNALFYYICERVRGSDSWQRLLLTRSGVHACVKPEEIKSGKEKERKRDFFRYLLMYEEIERYCTLFCSPIVSNIIWGRFVWYASHDIRWNCRH